MGSIVAHTAAVVQLLTDAGVPATNDPRRAASLGRCVLVPPPAVDYVTRANVYRLACLTDKPGGTLDALAQLDQLVQAVLAVPELSPETAEPASYVLAAGQPARPAYIITATIA